MLAIRYGAERLLAISAAGWSILTVLTPEAARLEIVIPCRIALGLFEGVLRKEALAGASQKLKTTPVQACLFPVSTPS